MVQAVGPTGTGVSGNIVPRSGLWSTQIVYQGAQTEGANGKGGLRWRLDETNDFILKRLIAGEIVSTLTPIPAPYSSRQRGRRVPHFV